MNINHEIQESYFFQITQKLCPAMNHGMQMLMTSSLAMLTFIAHVDKKISGSEIGYLKYFLKYEFALDQSLYRELVKSYVFVMNNTEMSDNQIKAFKNYLSKNLSGKDKRRFLDTLLCLSRSDQQISTFEKKFIRNIGIALELADQEVTNSILTESLNLVRKIDEQIAQDNELISDVAELNEIAFASVYDFMNNLK